MKLTVVLAALIGTFALACSSADVPSADPTPNVNTTVEARVAQEPVATPAVDTPTPSPTPTPILPPTAEPTPIPSPTPTPISTQTPVPTPRAPLVSTDILEVPLKIHLLTEMPMQIRNASGDGFCEDCELMDSWITQDQISNEIMPEVNRIYEQANIHWDIQEFIVEPAAQRSYAEAADWLSLSDRSSDNAERISKYFDLIPASTVDETMVNLYFVTFIGNTRQGRANKCSQNLPFGLSDPPFNMSDPSRACSLTINGQWSNKYLPDGAPPEKRVLFAPEGTPSLAMTVAHELGHTLDLSHPDSGEINLMQGATSGHNLTDEQISEAREFAFTYHDVTSTPNP